MRIKNTTARRATWRDRFVEIARSLEAPSPRASVLVAGLRPRARMAGFAVLRRAGAR
jgi:hypothetical protein